MTKNFIKKWIHLTIPLIIFGVFSAISCTKASNLIHFRGFSMKMPYHVAVVGPLSRHDRLVIKQIIDSAFSETNQISNHWNSHSELSFFNHNKSTKPVKLSPHLRELLTLAEEIVNLSDGKYDPTLGPAIDAWKIALSQHHEPSNKTLISLNRIIGWEHLSFNDSSIQKDIPELKLDLDAIAKGKCVDNITTNLVEGGYNNIYVEWSGEIRAHGLNELNKQWQIEIFSPKSEPNKVILLDNEAIATSGNYMQVWGVRSEEDGNVRIYSHLLNKETLSPIELEKKSILSVSVRAPTCALADGLATAAMLIETHEELLEWTSKVKETIPGVSFWIIEKKVL